MHLIYRGQTLNYTPAQAYVTRQPRVIHWRYQGSGDTRGDLESTPIIHSQAGSVNWHWQ
jgi:hypothetical protein